MNKVKEYTDKVLNHLPHYFFDKYEYWLVTDTTELDKIINKQLAKNTGTYLASLVLVSELPKNI